MLTYDMIRYILRTMPEWVKLMYSGEPASKYEHVNLNSDGVMEHYRLGNTGTPYENNTVTHTAPTRQLGCLIIFIFLKRWTCPVHFWDQFLSM